MRARVVKAGMVGASLLLAIGCDDDEKPQVAAAASASPSASAVPQPAQPAEPPPQGCQASSGDPVELPEVIGNVHGFAEDGPFLYYTSWDIYGNRGNLGRVRKDGQGARTLGSLQLEPRGLEIEGDDIFYTTGIRLMRVDKDGKGEEKTLDPKFSAQDIVFFKEKIYGVPGDYGPYDRIAVVSRAGGETKELATSDRPSRDVGPNGFSSLVVGDSGIFVTDSGNNRVLRFPLEGKKPKIIAARQDKPYDLSVVGDTVVFNLARQGRLMRVATEGGPVESMASGLVEMAPIVADSRGVYTVAAGEKEDAPHQVVAVRLDGGDPKPLAAAPADETVSAMALDSDCVYWTQRVDASTSRVLARAR